jgi:hypothetical protein
MGGAEREPTAPGRPGVVALLGDIDPRTVSSCGRQPGIQRVDLAGGGRETIPSGHFCGRPLTVHADRYLVLDADRVGRLGFPGTRPDGLRLLDLRSPAGAGG